MASILYYIKENGLPNCLYVKEDIDPSKLGTKQKFHVINGEWSGTYLDGKVTYYKDVVMQVQRDVNLYGNYNNAIYSFEKDVLGLHKER